jgi:hypothetical protein
MMFETFDGSCDATMVDDIVITRYAGSHAAAALINARSQAGIDIRPPPPRPRGGAVRGP